MPLPHPKPSFAPRGSAAPSRAASDGQRDGEGLLAAGELVAERYRVVRLLGEGGMGAVYLAEHVHMRKVVALKVLHADICKRPELIARFEREAVAAGHIEHPNVTAATDFGQLEDGSFFLVLEYVGGRSLRAELDAGAISPARALRILRGIVAGVGAAHAKGIIHRDLKPENVMLLERDGNPDFVKILDFGIAKLDAVGATAAESGAQPLTRLGAILGTPDYMSPEQALGQPVDSRTDLYSLGIILFEMIAGARPFRGGALSVLRDRVLAEAPPPLPEDAVARVDPRVQAILRKLLMGNAAARYQTATEVSSAVEEAIGDIADREVLPTVVGDSRAQPAPPAPLAAALADPPPAPPRLLSPKKVAAVAVAALILLGFFLTRGSSRPEAARAPAVGPARPALFAPPVPASSPSRATASAADVPPPPALPPPPSPGGSPAASGAASSARPEGSSAPQGGGGRRTGPGGIYIPPPSQWFR